MGSYQPPVFNKSLLSAVDLSEKQYRYVGENGSGKYNVIGSVNGAVGAGFLMNAPLANEPCAVATLGGGAMGYAAEAISAVKTELKANDDGELVAALPGDIVVAIALEASAIDAAFNVQPVYYVKDAPPVIFQAAADLTAKRYYYVGDSSGDVDVVGGANGAFGWGFLMNAPDTGEDAVINGNGYPYAKAISHDAISIGDKLISLATGKVDATTTTGDAVIAVALSASAGADEVIDVMPVYYPHP